jgi:hypothetical protein
MEDDPFESRSDKLRRVAAMGMRATAPQTETSEFIYRKKRNQYKDEVDGAKEYGLVKEDE